MFTFAAAKTRCSAVGSVPGLGPGCRRFESCHLDTRVLFYEEDSFLWILLGNQNFFFIFVPDRLKALKCEYEK